jgi:hypothetical protein
MTLQLQGAAIGHIFQNSPDKRSYAGIYYALFHFSRNLTVDVLGNTAYLLTWWTFCINRLEILLALVTFLTDQLFL